MASLLQCVRSFVKKAGVPLLAISTAWTTLPVQAELPENFGRDTRAILAAFQGLKSSNKPNPNSPPRLNEQSAQGREAMMQLMDLRPVLGQAPYTHKLTLARIFAFHGQFQHLRASYVDANTKSDGSYATELSHLMASELRLIAVTTEALNDFVGEIGYDQLGDVRKAGLSQAREGLGLMYLGATAFASDESTKPQDRARVVEALQETSAPIVSILHPDSRKDIVATLNAQLKANTAISKDDYAPLLKALRSKKCDSLCLIE